jgi:hypothetical protein
VSTSAHTGSAIVFASLAVNLTSDLIPGVVRRASPRSRLHLDHLHDVLVPHMPAVTGVRSNDERLTPAVFRIPTAELPPVVPEIAAKSIASAISRARSRLLYWAMCLPLRDVTFVASDRPAKMFARFRNREDCQGRSCPKRFFLVVRQNGSVRSPRCQSFAFRGVQARA